MYLNGRLKFVYKPLLIKRKLGIKIRPKLVLFFSWFIIEAEFFPFQLNTVVQIKHIVTNSLISSTCELNLYCPNKIKISLLKLVKILWLLYFNSLSLLYFCRFSWMAKHWLMLLCDSYAYKKTYYIAIGNFSVPVIVKWFLIHISFYIVTSLSSFLCILVIYWLKFILHLFYFLLDFYMLYCFLFSFSRLAVDFIANHVI